MIFVSNCPARPTNGSPCSSSSAPGASPTNMSCASMLPTPNTTFLRDDARCGHLTQDSARSRSAANAADFSICDFGFAVCDCVPPDEAGESSVGPDMGVEIGDEIFCGGCASARSVSFETE